jgi:imidazolonepropionase
MEKTLYGPFTQLLSLEKSSLKGALLDKDLNVISNAGILAENEKIIAVGSYNELIKQLGTGKKVAMPEGSVALPGFIDCHTHLCWGGSRALDYSDRINGVPYVEIAARGGGIQDSVRKTRATSDETLTANMLDRINYLSANGITTVEIKSGYGLNLEQELRILKLIKVVSKQKSVDVISTCLAAHVKAFDFDGSPKEYLSFITRKLLPQIQKEGLSQRVDIYVDDKAGFSINDARSYCQHAKKMGFAITIHADQFSRGGLELAIEMGAHSADHLEESQSDAIVKLKESETVATVLPGASLGLGQRFAPARKILDAGGCLAIASDWNPGSAPNGDLLVQSAFIGAAEKLSHHEVFAALSFRAAKALGLNDRGRLAPGFLCDFVVFDCSDYREILYNQGQLRPVLTYKRGKKVFYVPKSST